MESTGTSGESRSRTELEDDWSVDVEVTSLPNNKKRVDVRVERGRHWVLAVQDQIAGLIMMLNSNGQHTDDGVPNWLEPLLQQIGFDEVEI